MNHTQEAIIHFLEKNKTAYPHKVSMITTKQTHISWIFLTGRFAYKVKKQLKFGRILDFSTLQLRKKYCENEIRINKILCPDMYLGVVKIIKKDDSFKITDLPKKGKALEYGVKMREIPQKNRMDLLLAQKKVNKKTIDRLVSILTKFHKKTPTSLKIKKFGHPKNLLKKIDENFRTLETLKKLKPKFEKKLVSFINNNKKLLSKRIEDGKIRDIHGDLYLKNIFIERNSKFYLYDGIEFNEALRSADIAEDVAHFAMDLDFNNRADLRRYFISQYIKKSNDADLKYLVYFWMCYKACMRAKVSLFKAKNELDKKKKNSSLQNSKKFFKLASSYLSKF